MSSPLSPSMYVMAELHDAVDRKPGSYVNLPVFPYSVRMSMTSGPMVPVRMGKLTEGAPSEKLMVEVRSDMARLPLRRFLQAARSCAIIGAIERSRGSSPAAVGGQKS